MPPTYANYPSESITIGAGVAIFHLASARVVVCYHTRDRYYFLPKGRCNANEDIKAAAEREGFEESGYRNRVLPLPFKHRQPDPDEGHVQFVTGPIYTQLLPLSSSTQYVLFWHAAETIPSDAETTYAEARSTVYVPPPSYPTALTLQQRMAMDRTVNEDGTETVYEPVHHEGTGVDDEEACYQSFLVPLEDACKRLKGSVQDEVVRRAWKAIQRRMDMEQASKSA